MKAQVKSITSPDILDFNSYYPENYESFGFLLDVVVGITDRAGGDVFSFEVCTPKWLLTNYSSDDILFCRHKIIVFEYNIDKVIKRIKEYCESCTGATWEEIANKISRVGQWEFEDYRTKA